MTNEKMITILGASGDLGSQFSTYLIKKNRKKIRLVIRKGSFEKLARRINLTNNVVVLEVETLFDTKVLEEILISSKIIFNLTGLVSLSFREKAFPSVLLINSFFQGYITILNKSRTPVLYPSTQRIQSLITRKDIKLWINTAVKEYNAHITKATIRGFSEKTAHDFSKKFISRNPIPVDANIYDLSKTLGEELIKQNKKSIILRISSGYGPGYSERGTVGRLIFSRIFGDKKVEAVETRDYVYVNDINEIFEKMILLKNNNPLITYCCSGKNVGKDYIISEIIKNTPNNQGTLETTSNDMMKETFKPSGQWTNETLKRPLFSLEKGITETVNDYKKRYFSNNSTAIKLRLHTLYDILLRNTEKQGVDSSKLSKIRDTFFTFSNGLWYAHESFWTPTGIFFGYPFSTILQNKLDKTRKDILHKLNLKQKQYWLIDKNNLHITLVSYSHYSEKNMGIIFLPKDEVKIAKKIIGHFKPINLTITGTLITNSGLLLAKGFVENEDLYLLRDQLMLEIKGITQMQQNTVHIKLAQILDDIPYECSEKLNCLYYSKAIGTYLFTEVKTPYGESLFFS